MDSESIRQKYKQHLFPAAKNFYKEPIVVAEGNNVYVKDLKGNSYLDFFGGILTVSIGHCNDEVNNAVKEQIDRLVHISSLYPVILVVALAKKLANITPGRLEKLRKKEDCRPTHWYQTAKSIDELILLFEGEIDSLRTNYDKVIADGKSQRGRVQWDRIIIDN